MSETQVENKPTTLQKIVTPVYKHRTKILVVTNVATLATAIVFKSGLSQHNTFLKEHGLYDQFYAQTPEV